MNERYALAVAVFVLLALALMMRADDCGRASAQDRQDNAPAIVLARVCAKEAGFGGFADCPPIAAVLLKVGRGDVVRGARLHSRRVFDPVALRHRPWIAYLRGDGAQPTGWPANVSWRNQRPRWLRLVALARGVLDGPGEAPCAPDTWGGPMDRERARRIGYVRINCGPTVNDFYRNPPRRALLPRAAGNFGGR